MCEPGTHQAVYQRAEWGFWLRCIACGARSPVRPTAEAARRAWRREYGADNELLIRS